MSLWYCNEHGSVGPKACCARASRVGSFTNVAEEPRAAVEPTRETPSWKRGEDWACGHVSPVHSRGGVGLKGAIICERPRGHTDDHEHYGGYHWPNALNDELFALRAQLAEASRDSEKAFLRGYELGAIDWVREERAVIANIQALAATRWKSWRRGPRSLSPGDAAKEANDR